MVNMLDIKYSQVSVLINGQNNNETKKTDSLEEQLLNTSKSDFLDISSQTEILESSALGGVDFAALEKKLGIDSNTWGVEAVSDDLMNFANIMYDMYKLKHDGEDNQDVLDGFYQMAKDSYTQGYEEAKSFLGTLNDDVSTLIQGTFDRTMEKLDAWYENGGKMPETEDSNTTENIASESKFKVSITKTEIQVSKYEGTAESVQKYLDEAEATKNEILDLMKQQGLYLNSESSKQSSYDFKG